MKVWHSTQAQISVELMNKWEKTIRYGNNWRPSRKQLMKHGFWSNQKGGGYIPKTKEINLEKWELLIFDKKVKRRWMTAWKLSKVKNGKIELTLHHLVSYLRPTAKWIWKSLGYKENRKKKKRERIFDHVCIGNVAGSEKGWKRSQWAGKECPLENEEHKWGC